MDVLLLASRLVLCAVFLVAGVAKLADRVRAREDLCALGVPQALAHPAATALGCAEIVLGAALAFDGVAVPAALGALAILAAGIARGAWSVAGGREEDCGCFGSVRRSPIGARTIARDLLLAGAAVLLVSHGGELGVSPAGWIAGLPPLGLLAAAAAASLLGVLAFLLALARRRAARRLVEQLSARLADERTVS